MQDPFLAILVGLGILLLAILVVFFTFFLGKVIFRQDSHLPEWAQQNGFRIIDCYTTMYFRQMWYHVVVEDESGDRRKAWVTFGFFSGKPRVQWEPRDS
jgi:hypothetical protein